MIFDIFTFNKKAQRRSHLKNLIAIAMVDGTFGFKEYRLIYAKAFQLGFTKADIRAIKANPSLIEFKAPKKYEERMKQAYDLVNMMIVDKKIMSKEVALCKTLAFKLNLFPKVIDDLVHHFTVQKDNKISMVIADRHR